MTNEDRQRSLVKKNGKNGKAVYCKYCEYLRSEPLGGLLPEVQCYWPSTAGGVPCARAYNRWVRKEKQEK